METIDIIEAWQVDEGDLIQFEWFDGDERFIEILRVTDHFVDNEYAYVRVKGESLVSGDMEIRELDMYLEVEVMGA